MIGRAVAFLLSAGNQADVTMAPALVRMIPAAKRLVADKGYDSDAFRRMLRERRTRPIIPGRSNRKRKIRLDKRRYAERWRIEDVFCKIKDFRRVATRFDKLARNYEATVMLAILLCFWI